jgi:uncharacterized protein YcbX
MSDFSGNLTDILVYPIKSCAGVSVRQAKICSLGLQWDRQWLIVDDQGLFQTQRQIPHLVWVTATASSTRLTLSAPNQPDLDMPWANPHSVRRRVTIWKDTLDALDMGQAASDWLNAFLEVPGRSFSLVQFDPQQTRWSDPAWTGPVASAHQFADGFAINVLAQSSLDQLNDRRSEQGLEPLSAWRFRPNLILSGLDAHEEDHIRYLRFPTPEGSIEFELVKPCPRCQIPDIDPQTAINESDVSPLLATYRQIPKMDHAICFGMNGVVRAGAGLTLQVGQPFNAVM